MADLSKLNRVRSFHQGSFGGSVIIDGTAYSGADIKAVIHIYDPAHLTLERQIEEIDAEIGLLDSRINLNKRSAFNGRAEDIKQFEASRTSLINQKANLVRSLKEFGAHAQIQTKTLAEIQTLSVSTYREKYPVRALSAVYPKSHTRGPRTIAGSMVFTVFDRDVLFEILEADPTDFDAFQITSAIIDQLPPFDITINFANELGQTSRMAILGIEFASSGMTMSIHDMFIENTMQYVALDLDPMTLVGEPRLSVNNLLVGIDRVTTTGSSLLKSKKAEDLKELTNSFDMRFKRRNNPFI